MEPEWYAVTLPNNDSSKNIVKEIRNAFRIVILNPIPKRNSEITRLYLNKDEKDNYIVYFSPTPNEQIIDLIKNYSGKVCKEPNSFSIEILEQEPPFSIKRF